MARLHTRKRGKSGSKKPAAKVNPEWVEYSAHEAEELIEKFAKEGMNSTQIGLRLRDCYGIPLVKNLCGKSISKIMVEKGIKIEYPDDLMALIKCAVGMRKHIQANKRDVHNRTKLHYTESKIRRLVKYYRDNGKLPFYWAYDPGKAALLVK